MTKYHKWTEEEEKTLKEAVKAHPTNLSEAMRIVAKKFNLSVYAVKYHYYQVIQKNKDNKLFLTVSSKKKANNYKVTRKGKKATNYKPEPVKKSKWKRILAILAE